VAARDQLRQTTDLLLVEADACVMTPLSEDLTQLDLIGRLGYPVLLIGPSSRGVVDAALLSLEVLRSQKIPVAGVVFNRQKSELSPEEASYPYQVEKFFGPLVRGVLPHFDGEQLADLELLSSRLQVHVDLDSILQHG
jgi:dethiobiotin synthetase